LNTQWRQDVVSRKGVTERQQSHRKIAVFCTLSTEPFFF